MNSLIRAQGPQFGLRPGVTRFEPQYLLITFHRIGNLSQADEGIAQIGVNPRIIGREPQRLAIVPRGLVKTLFHEQDGGEIVVCIGGIRIQFQRRLKIRDGFDELFFCRQRKSKIVQNVGLGRRGLAVK